MAGMVAKAVTARRTSTAMVTQTLQVDFELLRESDRASAELTYDGRLFTGIAYETDRLGRLVSLSGYRDGRACGPLRTWYPSGQIEQEQYYRGGRRHGPWREWHPNGRPRVDAYYERGHALRTRVESARTAPSCGGVVALAGAGADESERLLDIDPSTWELVERPIDWGRDPSELPEATALVPRLHRIDGDV